MLLSEKIADTANVAAAGMVFGQVVGGQRFSTAIAVIGTALWAGMLACSVLLARSHRQ
jgi:hypothetical protein